MNKIEKELRLLKIYAVVSTLVCAVLFGLVFKTISTKKFAEIDVERINIVEHDGKLRMVLSNQVRQHPGTMDGATYEARKGMRPPGLIFFSEKGDEVGGLVFDGNTGKHHGGSLTFDKFRGDQTVQLTHDEEPDGKYFAGVKMNDQNVPLSDVFNKESEISGLPMAERIRIGRDYDKSAVVRLKDARGKVRIEIKVEADGHAMLNFLDDLGKVVYSLPPGAQTQNFRLTEIKPGSIYEKLGLKNGDELISFDGQDAMSGKELKVFLEKRLQTPGSVRLKIRRNGKIEELVYNIK